MYFFASFIVLILKAGNGFLNRYTCGLNEGREMFTKSITLSELYCSLKVTIRFMHIAINQSHPSPSSVKEPEDPTNFPNPVHTYRI